MDVKAAILGSVDEAWRHEESEGDGNDQVDRVAVGFGHL